MPDRLKEMFKNKYFIETGVWKVIMKPVFEVTVVDLHEIRMTNLNELFVRQTHPQRYQLFMNQEYIF